MSLESLKNVKELSVLDPILMLWSYNAEGNPISLNPILILFVSYALPRLKVIDVSKEKTICIYEHCYRRHLWKILREH